MLVYSHSVIPILTSVCFVSVVCFVSCSIRHLSDITSLCNACMQSWWKMVLTTWRNWNDCWHRCQLAGSTLVGLWSEISAHYNIVQNCFLTVLRAFSWFSNWWKREWLKAPLYYTSWRSKDGSLYGNGLLIIAFHSVAEHDGSYYRYIILCLYFLIYERRVVVRIGSITTWK